MKTWAVAGKSLSSHTGQDWSRLSLGTYIMQEVAAKCEDSSKCYPQWLRGTYLHILQCQHVFFTPLGHFHFGGHTTDATDHVIVVSDSEALKSPIAIAQQLL